MWRALIVAGGFGTRLSPFTKVIPKPLMPIGEHSLLERHVISLAEAGVRDIHVAVHYCADLFRSIVDSLMARYGVHIHLVFENAPKGTFGSALEFCTELIAMGDNSPLLVLNGDIASDVDLAHFHGFYVSSGADFAVMVNEYTYRVPYGVVDTDHSKMVRVREKPTIPFPVLSGYYFMRPSIANAVQSAGGGELGVDRVLASLLAHGIHIATFHHQGKWVDAGTIDDLHRANELFAERGAA